MTTRKVLALLVVQMAVFAVIGLALWSASGRLIADFATFSRADITGGVALAGAMIVLAALVLYGFPRLSEALVRAQAEGLAFLKVPLSLWGIVLLSLCAGIGEEALFRAGIQTLLADHIGTFPAIGVAAGLFALVHLAKPLVSALIFLIGALFGYVYATTGSLTTVALGHALYDVFALWYVQGELHRLALFAEEADQGARLGGE